MNTKSVIPEEDWNALMDRMTELGYEQITVNFNGGHDEGYCDDIQAIIGKGHKTFKEGLVVGEGTYLNPETKKWEQKDGMPTLKQDLVILIGTDDYDEDNGAVRTYDFNGENGSYRKIPPEEMEEPTEVRNLFAEQIYAEYGGFATESSVHGYVRVNAVERTVVFDDNWQDWVNSTTTILSKEE